MTYRSSLHGIFLGLVFGLLACGDDAASGGGGAGGSSSSGEGASGATSNTSAGGMSTSSGECTGECAPGTVEEQPCPWGPARTRTCDEECAWSEFDSCTVPNGWRVMRPSTDFGIEGRKYHQAFWTGTRMLVWGGSNVPIAYDPVQDTWEQLAAGPVGGYLGTWTGTKLIVVNPSDGISGASFDPATNVWTPFEGTMPIPLRGSFAITAWMPGTNEVLVFGGYKSPSELSDGAAYDFDTQTWRTIAQGPLAFVDSTRPPTAGWAYDRMLISGGGSNYGDRYDAAALYDPVADAWTSIDSSPSPGYTKVLSANVGEQNEQVVLWNGERFGGADFNYPTNGGAIWNGQSSSWSTIPAIPGEGMYDGHKFGAIWSNATSFGVWGGNRYANGFSSEDRGAIFDLASQTWSALPPAPIAGRTNVAGVWTGTEVIVWGGNDWSEHEPFADGAIYRP